jgi:hypothetical protein
VTEALKVGEEIKITGFGNFSVPPHKGSRGVPTQVVQCRNSSHPYCASPINCEVLFS